MNNITPAKYYKLSLDDSNEPGMVIVSKEVHGFNAHKFSEGIRIENWPENVKFYVSGDNNEDLLIGGFAWYLVSDRVRIAFEECNVEDVQFLPVIFLNTDNGERVGCYWVLHVLSELEALNWERTRWLYPEKRDIEQYPILNIIKEVFQEDVVKDVDIFRLRVKDQVSTIIYISERLKRCLENAEATIGFKFIPVTII